MILDPRTMFVMGAGFMVVTSLTLRLRMGTLPQDVRRSASTGAAATAFLALSWMLYALEGYVPQAVGVVVANGFYLLAIALVYQSVRQLDGLRAEPLLYLYTVVPALAAVVAARYMVDWYPLRVVVMSLTIALLLGLSARRLFVPTGTRSVGRRPAAYWMALGSALLLLRGVMAAAAGWAPPLMSGDTTASLAVAMSVILALGAAFAYFLIFNGRLTAELALQAHLDPLTELLNRRGFEERAQQELQRAARTSAPISLLMIDANGFKAINDRWGHQAGDRALCAIADGLRARVRPYDVVARLGGDEFVVLLPGVDAIGARAMVPRLKEVIAAQPTGLPTQLDVGIGRATLPAGTLKQAPKGRPSVDIERHVNRLIAEADKDMYSVKNSRF